MARVEGAIVITRPREEVFDFVADERNEPRYNPQMLRAEQISAGPIGRGTRFRAVSRTRAGTAEMTIEFTEFERPHRLSSATHLSNMDIQGTLTFEPLPEGTRMRWSWHVHPRGVMKVLAPLFGWVGRRREHAIWTGLKQYLERPAAPVGEAGATSGIGPSLG